MKLLLFSDLHCDISAAQALVERAAEVDVLVGAGDFGRCRSGIDTSIDVLRAVTRPSVLVPGNAESVEELTEACRGWSSSRVLHGTGATIDGVTFFGLGGGVPVTPFGNWSYDFTEEQAEELLADCPPRCVLVSHSPPLGATDLDSCGNNLGSNAVRSVVQQKQPLLVACGHIHNCWQQEGRIGNTPVINAGPRGVEWMIR